MDAGIAKEENLTLMRSEKHNYDYLYVSRNKPKAYDKLTDKATTISDNSDNKIEFTKVNMEGKPDYFLHIKSEQKRINKTSMDEKLSQRLVKQLEEIRDKLSKKTFKKITNIHEKVGGIKAKLTRVGYLYDITYIEDKELGIVTDIKWKRIKSKEKPIYRQKGKYIEPHIWLGIIACQVVNYIKRNLRKANINDSWTAIVNKISTKQSSATTVLNDKQKQL